MKQRKSRFGRYCFLLIALAVIATMTVSVSAYFIRNSGEVKNKLIPAASVIPEINESFNERTKENVCFDVGNTGYPVYVRAEIIVTWKNADGVVYFSKPLEYTDYSLTINGDYWKKGEDGYYYYWNKDTDLPIAVESGGSTEVLINRCRQIGQGEDLPEGYTLNVEILVQTVQAIGHTDGDGEDPATMIPAYEDAWDLS